MAGGKYSFEFFPSLHPSALSAYETADDYQHTKIADDYRLTKTDDD